MFGYAKFVLFAVWITRLQLILCGDKSDKTICDISPNNINLTLKGAFIFKEKLFFLTYDWYVYELPNTYLDIDYGRLLMNETAKKIEDKWSVFKQSTHFAKIKSEISIIFSFNNAVKPVLLFLAKKIGEVGIMFNIKTHELQERYTNNITDNIVMISNLENDMYALMSDQDDNQISLQKWVVEYHPNNEVKQFETDGKLLYSFLSSDKTKILLSSDKKPKLLPKGYTSFKENSMNGFIWRKRFHLFSNKFIYIFEKESATQLMKPFEFKVVKANDYFVCNIKDFNKNKGMAMGIVIAIILVVLCVILIGLLLIKQQVVKNHRHRHKHKKGNLGAQSVAPSNIPTNRSAMSMISQFFNPSVASANPKCSTVVSNVATTRSADDGPDNKMSQTKLSASSSVNKSMNPNSKVSNMATTRSTEAGPSHMSQAKLSTTNSLNKLSSSRTKMSSVTASKMPTNRSAT